jgi:putative transposase
MNKKRISDNRVAHYRFASSGDMLMKYDPKVHHRRSIRLLGYDYRNIGAYFVTMVTFQRECLLGDVVNGEIRLSRLGQIVEEEWLRTGEVRRNVELDGFVIMPNHLHVILAITSGSGTNRETAKPVGTSRRFVPTRVPTPPAAGSIGAIMAQFKSIVTKRINVIRQTPSAPFWQRNYYEHIIRNDKELDQIRQYIANNPLRWESDDENPTHRTGPNAPR